MKAVNYIAMDVHGKTTDICNKRRTSDEGKRWHVATTIPALTEVIESIPRPRQLTFEEGPLADWLHRELQHRVEKLVVSDPRRNALIAKDGDKDDPIDAGKLCDLMIGGYLRAVHHSGELERTIFKRQVGLYHERVEHRVSEANKIIGRLKGWGLVVKEKDFREARDRKQLLECLGVGEAMKPVREQVQMLWRGYDVALEQEQQLRREVESAAKQDEQMVRLTALPGIAWIRAATFTAYLDTPWRFVSKESVWRYMGIGLRRARSGEGREYVGVDLACNHRLKAMIVGAADSAIQQGDNEFAALHARWIKAGLSPQNARRNVARRLAATGWGMWKNGNVYDPSRVRIAAC